jgi:hypothetical protein
MYSNNLLQVKILCISNQRIYKQGLEINLKKNQQLYITNLINIDFRNTVKVDIYIIKYNIIEISNYQNISRSIDL